MKKAALFGVIALTMGAIGYFVYPMVEVDLHEPKTQQAVDDEIPPQDENETLDEKLGDLLPGKWEGYSDVGKGIPAYFEFTREGMVSLYETDIDDSWIQMQEFKLVKGRIKTDDKNIDDILSWQQVLDYELVDLDAKLEDYTCMTLYPEGAQVGAVSPFNMVLCLNGMNKMKIDMLKHTFYLEKKN